MAALADEEARVARELAVRSLVLVENDGILPLRKDVASVAVIGPIADSARELLGDYAHLLHIETLLEMRHNGNAFGFPLTDEIVPADELAGRRTILDEIDARLPGADVQHCPGHGHPRRDRRRDRARPSSWPGHRTWRSSCSASDPA